MAIDKAYLDFDKLFQNGKLPSGGYTSTYGLLSHLSLEYQSDFQVEHENSKDGKTSFVALELLCDLLLMPYAQSLSIGGGSCSSNNRVGVTLTMKTRRSSAFASITHILINPNSNVNDKLWLQINKKIRKWLTMM